MCEHYTDLIVWTSLREDTEKTCLKALEKSAGRFTQDRPISGHKKAWTEGRPGRRHWTLETSGKWKHVSEQRTDLGKDRVQTIDWTEGRPRRGQWVRFMEDTRCHGKL